MIRVDIRLYLNPLSHRHAAAARTTGSHRATNTVCRKSASDPRAAGTVCWATSNAWAVCPVRDWVSDAHGWSCCGISGSAKEQTRSRLLGILIGALGIHNFYLGFTGKAIAQLLITVLSFGLLSFIPAIWGLIEGILILTGSMNVDANGIPLTD